MPPSPSSSSRSSSIPSSSIPLVPVPSNRWRLGARCALLAVIAGGVGLTGWDLPDTGGPQPWIDSPFEVLRSRLADVPRAGFVSDDPTPGFYTAKYVLTPTRIFSPRDLHEVEVHLGDGLPLIASYRDVDELERRIVQLRLQAQGHGRDIVVERFTPGLLLIWLERP